MRNEQWGPCIPMPCGLVVKSSLTRLGLREGTDLRRLGGVPATTASGVCTMNASWPGDAAAAGTAPLSGRMCRVSMSVMLVAVFCFVG